MTELGQDRGNTPAYAGKTLRDQAFHRAAEQTHWQHRHIQSHLKLFRTRNKRPDTQHKEEPPLLRRLFNMRYIIINHHQHQAAPAVTQTTAR